MNLITEMLIWCGHRAPWVEPGAVDKPFKGSDNGWERKTSQEAANSFILCRNSFLDFILRTTTVNMSTSHTVYSTSPQKRGEFYPWIISVEEISNIFGLPAEVGFLWFSIVILALKSLSSTWTLLEVPELFPRWNSCCAFHRKLLTGCHNWM